MRRQLYVLAALPALLAASAAPLSFQNGSRVWVSGTSTVRAWRCESAQVEGTARASTTTLSELKSVPGAELSIPVAALDCRNNTMNGHMRTALKAAENPQIRLRASSIEVSADGAAKIVGQLTIAGSTQPVTIDGTVASEDGQLRVRGTRQLDMTQFGVRPPSLMMGTMKVRPAVTVGFDVVLKP
ncbi:MAG TPA: YceI family protein [Longimicrobium sp.]|jgi:polyisoprenoid-binding protein YceI